MIVSTIVLLQVKHQLSSLITALSTLDNNHLDQQPLVSQYYNKKMPKFYGWLISTTYFILSYHSYPYENYIFKKDV